MFKRMMVNLYLDWRRGSWFRWVFLRSETDEAVPVPADHAELNADRDLIWQVLARLPKQQRAALVLRYYEDLPDAEIADTLGCRWGTARGYISRGLVRSCHSKATYPLGCREFTGEEVIDLLRQRWDLPLGSLDRDDNAQRVMAGLLAAAADLGVVELSQLLQIKGVTFDLAGYELASLLTLLDEVDLSAVVGLGHPSLNLKIENDRSFVALRPEASELFEALQQDRMHEFVVDYPDWVTAIH